MAVGAAGTVLVTSNAGASWSTLTPATGQQLDAVTMVSATLGWASGTGGVILTYGPGASAVADFGAGNNWSLGTNAFGACLETTSGGALGGAGNSAWTVAGSGNCTSALNANWYPIVATAVTSGAKIAAVPGGPTVTAVANLRFGFRAGSAQAPGIYGAPIILEVAAPNV